MCLMQAENIIVLLISFNWWSLGRELREAPLLTLLSRPGPLLTLVHPSGPPITKSLFPGWQMPQAPAVYPVKSGILKFTQHLVAEQSAALLFLSVGCYSLLCLLKLRKMTLLVLRKGGEQPKADHPQTQWIRIGHGL